MTPAWPGLYPPLDEPKYLYTAYAIWRFTVLWTLVFYGILFLLASCLCVPIFAKRHLRLALSAPVIGTFFGLLGAFVSATVVGYALAALYNAAFLRVSAVFATLGCAELIQIGRAHV